jgi:hypothetical protein
MNPTRAFEEGASSPGGNAAPAEAALLDSAGSLWHELQGLLHDHLALAALETRLAGTSLVRMVVAGLMIAALLVSAWLLLMGVAVLGLVSVGVAPTIALLLAIVANLVLALILRDGIRRQGRNLQFPRTVRNLRAPSAPRGSEL